ncbi:2-dehydropantoate 2-reductase [Neobacillus sp. FSL H8-0543]|uniref:ketopantoate reductase family protein n=1 Tax=Neobacillus sp. FSL H8-0543 TaxID=2954672 RepID=UPI0031585C71
MKIGVAGTGAVGGYFGGLLKESGNEVVFFVRGDNLKTFHKKGLTIESEAGKITIDGIFSNSYQSFSDIDLLLFCVKSTATTEVATNILPYLKKDCLILTLQNGVDNEEILAAILGRHRILSAATYLQASVEDIGVVKQIGVPPRLVLGALDPSLVEKVTHISTLFNNSNIVTFPSSNILVIKWKKLLWNVTFNPLTAIIESNIGTIFDDDALKPIAIRICKEAMAVARKLGFEIEENFHETIIKQGQFARNHQTSMLQDKLNGKAMELESICGYIVKAGKQVNVDTPVLETIYHLLIYQDKKRTQGVER